MKFIVKILRYLFISLAAVILVTVGIDAADKYDNLSESIVGRLVLGEPEGPCPVDMVFVPTDAGGFCMDKFEVSPSEQCPSQTVGSQADTRSNIDYNECVPVSRRGVKPWTYVSQSQAIALCAKAGKRLPSSEEWYLASLGTPDSGSSWQSDDCHLNSNWEMQPGTCGSGEKCVSSYGAYDMVGNVWEWVKEEVVDGKLNGRDLPNAGYVSDVNSEGMVIATSEIPDPNYNDDYLWIKKSGSRAMMRGGYWGNARDAGIYANYLVSQSSFAGDAVGFRCVK